MLRLDLADGPAQMSKDTEIYCPSKALRQPILFVVQATQILTSQKSSSLDLQYPSKIIVGKFITKILPVSIELMSAQQSIRHQIAERKIQFKNGYYFVYNTREIKMKGKMMRIVVVGDQGVGKTSLICAIISDLASEVPKTHKKVVLPPDMCAYSKDMFTQIVDTSVSSNLRQQIRNSDLVLLVYDVSNSQSVVRLREHWLPIIHNVCKETPVVLVGNKYDKIQLPIDQEKDYTPIREVLRSLIRAFKQVQMGIECSAYYDKNVKKVLNSAQCAILYPLAPLYDLTSKQITSKFRKALIRIFRILDKSQEGYLTDDDLNSLQERVFQTQLNSEDIRAIKNIIEKQAQQQYGNTISVNGFIAFQRKCIEMLKIQICWSILRYFDYNNDLEIKNVSDSFVIKYEEGETLELSNHALDFLHRIYIFAQKNGVQGVSPMQKLFQSSPSIPLQQFRQQPISLQRFILIWHLFAYLNYKECYRAMLYIGYQRKLDECFNITRSKKTYSDLLKIKDRSTFSILFIQDDQYSLYLKGLFQNAVEEDYLTRNVILYSNQRSSKVINIFKIRQRHFHTFLTENQLNCRLDLVVYFTQDKMVWPQLCSHVMTKQITRQIADKIINLFELPELDLKSLPVTYKQSHNDRLLQYLTNIFEHIQEGYSADFIQGLKNESNKLKNVFLGIASTLSMIALGLIAYNRRATNK